MKRLFDALGCFLLFAAIVLFAFGVPFGIWEAITRHSLLVGFLVIVCVAVLVGMVLLARWLTGRTGGFTTAAGASKRRVGPPPEWHWPAPPTSGAP
jgi:hypothetical protein